MERIARRITKKPAADWPPPLVDSAWAPASLALLMLLNLAGCSSVKTFQIESRPPEHQVVIDGKADDWAGRLFVVGSQKVSLGFQNDRDYLYICLRTDDRTMRREFLRSGLTVWIDARGKRTKSLGIKYPVGLRSYEQRMWRDVGPDEGEAPGEIAGNLTDVEIYRRGSPEPESLDIADAEGLELKAEATGRNFIYELKVPLATSTQGTIGIGAPPGGTLGIGFETGRFDLDNLPRRPGGMIGGAGGMPPVGGYGGRGGVMRPGRMRPNDPEIPGGLKLWATVKLGPDGSPAPAKIKSLSE